MSLENKNIRKMLLILGCQPASPFLTRRNTLLLGIIQLENILKSQAILYFAVIQIKGNFYQQLSTKTVTFNVRQWRLPWRFILVFFWT